jgi:hypothetical protein
MHQHTLGGRRKQKKELAKLKAPPEYSLPVDFKKVVLPSINAWVMQRVKELLKGLEDEVLVGTIIESLKQVLPSPVTSRSCTWLVPCYGRMVSPGVVL